MLKKSLSIIMCLAMLFVFGTSSALAENKSTETMLNMDSIEIEVDYESAQINDDGTTTYDVSNAKDVALSYGIDDAKSVKVTIFNENQNELNFMPQAASYNSIYIDNIIKSGEGCGTEEITRNTAINRKNKKIDKEITLIGTVSNEYSLNVEAGINVEVASISSAVGFNVSKTWSMSDNTIVSLEPNESVTVYAYPLYNFYQFDVMKNPLWGSAKNVGSGSAYKCKGFCTVIQ